MHTFKPLRRQGDGLGDMASDAAALDCSNLPDLARQEFKDEADVNHLMRRFGVGAFSPPNRPGSFGEVDWDMDLQNAMFAVGAADRMYRKLPPDLRAKYPSWETLLNALRNGELKIDLEAKPAEPPKAQPDPPPTT